MNTVSTSPARLLLGALLISLCTTAHAQTNALSNPGFESNLSGWDVFEGRVGVWSETDADGSDQSGSALLSNQGTSDGNIPLVLHQCVGAQAGTRYDFGGRLMVPADQPDVTRAYIFVQAFTDPDCTGSNVQVEQAFSSSVGSWASVISTITAGQTTESLRIGLGVFKPVGEMAEAQAHFDNVFLLSPDPTLVEPSKSASWFNPDEGGHGIMIHLLDSTDAWMCWFAFDLDGNPAWICGLGVIDRDTITFEEAFTVEGGAFPPNFDPDLVEEVPWGSITVQFTGCDTGTLTWTTNAPGFQSGSMPIERLTTHWGVTCQEG